MLKKIVNNKIELIVIAITIFGGYLLKLDNWIFNIIGFLCLIYLFVLFSKNTKTIWLSLLYSIFLGGIRTITIFGRTPTIFYSDIIIFFFVIVWGMRCIKEKHIIFHKTEFDWLFLLFILLNFVSLTRTHNILKGLALLRLVNMGVLIFYSFIIFNRDRTKKELEKYMIYYLLFGFVVFMQLIMTPLLRHQTLQAFISDRSGVRLSWGGPANYLAMIFNLFIPMYIGTIFNGTFGYSFFSLLSIFGIFLTSSRSGILSLSFSVFAMVVKFSLFIKRKVWIILLIILLSGLAVFIKQNSYTSLVFKRFQKFNLTKIYTGTPRHVFLKATLKIMKSKPIMGIGWGNYRSFLKQNFPKNIELHDTAINIFLTEMANAGFLGLIALGLLLYIIFKIEFYLSFKQDYFNRHFEQFVFIGILAFFIHTLFEDFFINYHIVILFWTLIGMQYVKYFLSKKRIINEKKI